MRKRVYPGWVESGKISAIKAREEIEAMEAVERTLRIAKDMVNTLDRDRRRVFYSEIKSMVSAEATQQSLFPDEVMDGYGRGGL